MQTDDQRRRPATVVTPGDMQHPDRVGDWVEAADAHRAAVRLKQTQLVLDPRRPSRAIGAHEAVDRPAWQRQTHRRQGPSCHRSDASDL